MILKTSAGSCIESDSLHRMSRALLLMHSALLRIDRSLFGGIPLFCGSGAL